MDPCTATAILSGGVIIGFLLSSRKTHNDSIQFLSKLEESLDREIEYIEKFRGMESSIKYSSLIWAKNELKNLNYKDRFWPLPKQRTLDVVETCVQYNVRPE